MAQHAIINDSPITLRYTVTAISANPDGTAKVSNTETRDVASLTTAYVQLDGQVVVSVEVLTELPTP